MPGKVIVDMLALKDDGKIAAQSFAVEDICEPAHHKIYILCFEHPEKELTGKQACSVWKK